jgi:7,8-dihydropterin-6-yl-methyl-4-(beta-D-ribofuranosyl)aminobenzene 5'-phosphate synthase
VVLSHGHWDHAGGLHFLKNKTLITHPSAFIKRYRKSNHSSVGIHFSKNDIFKNFELTETKEPYLVTPNLFFLGQIPRLNNFESQTTSFEFENGEDDFIEDDSALAAIVNQQLIVVSGCSHSGICNICEYAQKVTGIENLNTVIGGFHLNQNNQQTIKTIQYFKSKNVKNVLPSHCTGLAALAAFFDAFKVEQVKTGQSYNFKELL